MNHLHECHEDGIDLVSIGGDIDVHDAPTLRALLQSKARQRCPALLLDLSRVDFIDASAVAAILEYLRGATDAGQQFCIGGLSEPLRTVFGVVGLGRMMPVYMQAAKAKEAIAGHGFAPMSKPLFASAN